MSAPVLALALCFAGVFCLSPLAVYLLWLAGVNRRPRPTVVSGQSDFIALVAGLSGFLIFGSLLAVTVTQSNARYWTRGNFEQVRAAWDQEKGIWLMAAGSYVALVVTGAIVGYVRRKNTLAVYAADPDGVIAIIDAEVTAVSTGTARSGYGWGTLVRLEPNVGMGHATVRVTATDAGIAGELDRRLRAALPFATPAITTPAAWFHTAAIGCGIGAVCSLGLVFFYSWLMR